MPGPIPNREADLARPRERKGSDVQPVTRGEMLPTKVPNADREWHPIARRLWDSVKASGQTAFYQQSDYAVLYSLCDDLSHFKKSGKRSSQMAQTIYSALGNLLVTEGDRRRARIELHEPEDEGDTASVLAIADYKKDLGLAE
ncbi:terminase small subunit [Streptomyces phage phiScoe44]|nr:terminase small subunit [Streptomyces phage phiScoe44]